MLSFIMLSAIKLSVIALGWERLARDKHSSLLGQFVSYQENEVLVTNNTCQGVRDH